MDKGLIRVYCGPGRGKTTAAIGQGIQAASLGKSVIVIQFLKGKNSERIDFIKRLEPEVKLFSFEKSAEPFASLSEEEQREEVMNIKNGLNFAKKVLVTGECDILILDEILGVLENGILTMDDLNVLLQAKEEETELIMTGVTIPEELYQLADEIYSIEVLKKA